MADTLFATFEEIGRAVMDLGLAGFLEKFEDHFGRGLTKALLILIGLAVAALCGSVVWTYLLRPLAELLPDPGNRSTGAYQFAKLTVILALFMMVTNQLLGLFDNYIKRNIRMQMREKVAEARRVTDEARDTFEEAKQFHKEAARLHGESADALAAANLVLDQVLSGALERGWITPEQADELRALKENTPKSAPEA